MFDIPEFQVRAYHQTGSTVICDPPVDDTDIDFVVYVYDKEQVKNFLMKKDWKVCGAAESYDKDGPFIALRKGKLNYILVDTEQDYDKWEAAMLLAKKRNLVNKTDRVRLFRNIKAGVGKKSLNGDFFDPHMYTGVFIANNTPVVNVDTIINGV